MSLQNHLVTHLQQMFVNERDYQIYLCDWSGKVKDQQLKSAVSQQIRGINTELDNLKQCLENLGAPLNDSMVSPMVQAMRQEDLVCSDMTQQPTPLDMDVHLAMNDISFGSLEIGIYQGLLTMARTLHNMNVTQILEDTLQNEEEDLQTMQSLLNDLISLSEQQKAA